MSTPKTPTADEPRTYPAIRQHVENAAEQKVRDIADSLWIRPETKARLALILHPGHTARTGQAAE